MSQFDTRVPVVLVRTDPNPFHHGTLGAVRSLGRAGIDVRVVARTEGSPVRHSRYVRGARTPVPSPDGGDGDRDEAIFAALGRVAAGLAHPAVLVALDDASAIAVARAYDRLADRFLLPAQPTALPEQVADKQRLAALCVRLGVAHPETVAPGDEREAATAARRLGLPVVAKWSRPWLLPPGTGLRSTCLLRTSAEAAALFRRSGQAGSELLLQEFLPGGHGLDWFFHGYASRRGTLHGGGTGRKEQSWPRAAGLTALGRWIPQPAVEETAAALVEALGYRGILDLDFRLDPASGRYHLLDFNPRPGAQFRLFADGNDMDVVRAQHLDLTHRPLPVPRPRPGRVFVAEQYAPLHALLPAPARRRERAWLAADDPAPALATALLFGRHALRHLATQARRTLLPLRTGGTTALDGTGKALLPAQSRGTRDSAQDHATSHGSASDGSASCGSTPDGSTACGSTPDRTRPDQATSDGTTSNPTVPAVKYEVKYEKKASSC
ncbi:ATP-grasp domain-containing protein [Streptomyces sp. NA04227]|uniref:carboxylate--amine ligase n=1 Tax=Streptomyces sp. NA04227 TaxID=2742136 RepID=UPI001590D241|nr:ATP-grasp domain-containing protein [Streptomyces sp. NA04227]QKW07429.1 ATP-grasp domain-containing protein [Streptomyces sp. NA04227]